MTSITARNVILTGGVTAITVLGAIYGAQLKDAIDTRQKAKAYQEIPIESRIADLERARAQLLLQRTEYEKKINEIRARRVSKGEFDQG